jgi:hypothetical protein
MVDVEAAVDAEVDTNPSIEVVETPENEELEVAIGEQRPKEARSRTITDGSSWSWFWLLKN